MNLRELAQGQNCMARIPGVCNFNPWTGKRRDARDVGADTFGLLIIPPDEKLRPAHEKGDVP